MKILLVEREIEIGLGTGAMMAEALTKMAQQAVTTWPLERGCQCLMLRLRRRWIDSMGSLDTDIVHPLRQLFKFHRNRSPHTFFANDE
jgi:hypothetical protein